MHATSQLPLAETRKEATLAHVGLAMEDIIGISATVNCSFIYLFIYSFICLFMPLPNLNCSLQRILPPSSAV